MIITEVNLAAAIQCSAGDTQSDCLPRITGYYYDDNFFFIIEFGSIVFQAESRLEQLQISLLHLEANPENNNNNNNRKIV